MSVLRPEILAPASSRDDDGLRFDPVRWLGVFRARLPFFVIPYVLVLLAGVAYIHTQHPIYRSVGKILVESPAITADLVRSTITEVALQRVQIIQQKIMAKDNLIAVIDKYGLFPQARQGRLRRNCWT